MALTTDVPNVPHSQLDVLPPAEWEKQKDRFAYSSWIRQTLAGLDPNKPAYAEDAKTKGSTSK
jgi:hypothetical protein